MNKNEKKKSSSDDTLDIVKIMEEFQKAEESPSGRTGTFKINKPFDEALDMILKTKPEPKNQSKKR